MTHRQERMVKTVKKIVGQSLVELVPELPLFVTEVEVSKDLRYGTIWVGSFENIGEDALLAMLKPHEPLIQQRLADHLETKFTPKLRYRADLGSQHQAKIQSLLQKIQDEEE